MDESLGAFTIRALFDFISSLLLVVGLFFMLVGAIGVVRLPDCYHRIHAASMCTTLGASAMILAAAFHIGDAAVAAKSAVTIIFLFAAVPVGSHLLAKAAHHGHAPQWPATAGDDLAEDKDDPAYAINDDVEATGPPAAPPTEGDAGPPRAGADESSANPRRTEADLLSR
jgi:multicomponent Na+:H+ antiporter subunit G